MEMEFNAWASVVDSYTDGRTIEFLTRQNSFTSFSFKYVTDYYYHYYYYY
jgi:hypothetical protein